MSSSLIFLLSGQSKLKDFVLMLCCRDPFSCVWIWGLVAVFWKACPHTYTMLGWSLCAIPLHILGFSAGKNQAMLAGDQDCWVPYGLWMYQWEWVRRTGNPKAQANKVSQYSQYPLFLLKNTRSLKFPLRINKSAVGSYHDLMLVSKSKYSGEERYQCACQKDRQYIIAWRNSRAIWGVSLIAERH